MKNREIKQYWKEEREQKVVKVTGSKNGKDFGDFPSIGYMTNYTRSNTRGKS